ncbi:hypothetical protein ABIE87_006459 [Bradyrhizobium diazoefficiens]|uniref:hypothetical protein n=1 Tax=Bradyrhizobium diazoefficiens TaxID=1355477 RepID=UPI00351483E0
MAEIDLNYILPCDVLLRPATTITKGCTLSTLLAALKVRESPDWQRFEDDSGLYADKYRQAIHDLTNTTDCGAALPNGK